MRYFLAVGFGLFIGGMALGKICDIVWVKQYVNGVEGANTVTQGVTESIKFEAMFMMSGGAFGGETYSFGWNWIKDGNPMEQ